MSETQINELKRDLKYKGEIIKSLTESNNNLIVNQEITALAIKELQDRYTHNAKKPKLHFSLNNGEIVRKKSNYQCKVLIMNFYTKLKTQKNSQKIEKELDMNTGRYSKLLEDLKQCTELITCDFDEMVIELNKREKKALIEVIDIFENIFMHFEDTDSLRYYLDDDDDED